MRLATIAFVCLALAPALAPSAPSDTGVVRGKLALIKNGKRVAVDPKRPEQLGWVYLKPTGKHHGKAFPGTGVDAEIRQVNEQFMPHVVVVPVGARVAFPNYDKEDHNVWSPGGGAQWDLGRYTTDHKGKTRDFLDAGAFDIYCDIHQPMWATVKVVETTYFAQAAADGSYAIANVAPGVYNVIAWAANSPDTTSSKTVTVTAGGEVTLAEELHVQEGDPPKHFLRKDGSAYTSGNSYQNR